jgi:hypothetical protein
MDNQPMSRKAPPPDPVTAPVLKSVPLSQGDAGPRPALARRSARKADDPVSLGLRKLWENVEKEPVPDAMLALLDAIDAARNPQAPGAQYANAIAPPGEPREMP